jgi:eukaryotic-like serine/threonine-protein kinase
MTTPIPLGAFLLEAPLGEGGMARVWRGVHARTGVPAAVKVMGGSFPRDLDARAFFREEVHAVARLDHPAIVMVLDQGEVDARAAEASGGLLRAGSPYLAMELAATTLRVSPGIAGWADVRDVLLALLAALAHAHSRGVVHRDVKPSNVLVFPGAGEGRTLKLADFGLAFALDRQGQWADPELVSGTPWNMAPEQLLGAWRDYGPWTDLYALGCLGYELACGRPAFAARGQATVAEAREHIPRLRARMSAPPGFEAWLVRLLQPDPRDRFQRAADAAFALRLFQEQSGGTAEPYLELSDAPTAALLQAEEPTVVGSRSPAWPREGEPRLRPPLEKPAPRALSPFPSDWRTEEAVLPVAAQARAELGLFGLRPIAMVGRSAERDVLWQALRLVYTQRRPRGVVLSGAPGLGKTRLADWLGERAHEAGVANVMKAFHGSLGGPGDGLPRMVSRFLRCIDLEPAELLERTEGLLRAQGVEDPAEWQALTALLGPASCPAWPGDGPQGAAAERHALVIRLLRRLSHKRPVVVLLDDVQWGADALRFAQTVFDDPDPLPVLLLLTLNEDALGERHIEAHLLEDLERHTTRLEVPPLLGEEQRALIQRVLFLQSDLVSTVQARTVGNPLFAVHLLDHWVHRGALVPGDHGFALRPGEPVPRDVEEVWRERLEAIVAEAGIEAGSALELAAALGQWVNQREWEQACACAGLPDASLAVDALVAHRLARRVQGGWTFSHGLLRDDLERVSRASGRWSWLNRACAAALEARARTGERGVAERVGRHWRAAGDPAAAVAPLLRGAREHRETSDYRVAHTLLETRDQALRLAGVGAEDAQWGEGWVLRARVSLHEGDLDTAFRWAALAEREGGRQGWLAIRAEALRLLGDAHRRRGELRQAHQLYTRCLTLRPERDTRHGMAASLWGLGDVARQRGDAAEAAVFFHRAGALYEEIGDRHGVADQWVGLADVAYQVRDLAGAASFYGRALSLFEELGNRYGVARARNGEGEVARARGDLDGATEAYRRSEALLVLVSSAEAMFPRLNLGLVALQRDRREEATSILRSSRDEAVRLGWHGVFAFAQMALLPGYAAAGDWSAWDTAFDSAEAVLDGGLVEPDVAWAARLAAERAAEAGDLPRARRALRLAIAQAEALGDKDAAQAARAQEARLG